MNLFQKIFKSFSNDIGIDLGTANTLVYLRGQGIIIDEPSIVAVNKRTGRIVAVGKEAKKMQGRSPEHIDVVRPLSDGVISDFEVTEEMLHYLIRKAERLSRKRFKVSPRVVVGVPSGITNVEIRAVIDATKNAGAREVYIVEEPMAGAIGIGLPVHEPVGSMIIDIGGGTTDIAAISLGGIVQSKNLRIAGDVFNAAVIAYLRQEFKILIGERTGEEVKVHLGSALVGSGRELSVRGRDIISGLPREIVVSDTDVRQALAPAVAQIVDAAQEVLEATPPELLADIMKRGVFVCGGGSLIGGIAEMLSDALMVPVTVAQEPLSAVARGTGMILEDIEVYKDILTSEHDELPPR
ncbi:MAG: rod shape-determining protein MreB [Planctomycetota bacterium]|jgi:rod shape-determining protein MreB